MLVSIAISMLVKCSCCIWALSTAERRKTCAEVQFARPKVSEAGSIETRPNTRLVFRETTMESLPSGGCSSFTVTRCGSDSSASVSAMSRRGLTSRRNDVGEPGEPASSFSSSSASAMRYSVSAPSRVVENTSEAICSSLDRASGPSAARNVSRMTSSGIHCSPSGC